MLPLRLFLDNFMCFRGETSPLELEGLHLACLCGDNGHGKSALLDAITWALWGRSRASGSRATSDDDLVSMGETETQVSLDFQARGVRYRVVRRHAKPRGRARSGQTRLDLYLVTEAGDEPRSLTGNALRETQATITNLLGLDYETFVNSAFLQQGQADRFTVSDPTERKRVLGDILALSLYDRLEERARARRQDAESRLRSLNALLEQAHRELARREEVEKGLTEEEGRLALVEAQLRARESGLKALRERQARLAGMEEQALDLKNRLAILKEERGQAQQQNATILERLEGYQALLAQEETVVAGFLRLQEARRRFQELASRAAQFAALTARSAELERVVDRGRNDLTGEIQLLDAQAQQDRERAGTAVSLSQERTGLMERMTLVTQREEALARARGEAQEAATAVQVLRETNAALLRQMEELRGKVDLLGEGVAVCPLCGTEMGEGSLAQVRAHYESEGQEMGWRYRENQSQARQREQERQSLAARLEQEEDGLRRDRSGVEGRLAVVRQGLTQAEEAALRLTELDTRVLALRARLAQGTFAQDEQSRLVGSREELAGLGYVPEEQEEVESHIRELEPFEARHRALEEARAGAPREAETLGGVDHRLARMEEEGRSMADRLAAMEGDLTGREALDREVAETQEAVELEGRLRDAALSEVARRRGELASLDRVAGQQEERQGTLRRTADERDSYAELVDAFGKQGVQALLIESALPEIEEEANALLARMTEGRMSLRLESQRETRQGRVTETLEVRIGDEWGTRPYEMYSGGEAFRINLALRIGLSRLLARRSGAPLPVLFIDEGFGTQDAQGRDRVVEAIGAIQEEFDLILVITHIPELKELFPVRIEVEKRGTGSTFTLVA